MLTIPPPSPALIQEKNERLLGLQLGEMIRPMFDSFEEEGLFGSSPHGSFVTYVLSQEMGKALAQSPQFESFVEELTQSVSKK